MKKIVVSSLLFIFVITSLSMAQGSPATLKMGTGGATGNYFDMGNDIHDYCKDVVDPQTSFEVLESAGSVANILGMNNKLYSAGIAQEDVLQYYAKQDPRKVNINRMKIIAGLHLETVYLLIPNNFQPKAVAGGKQSLWGTFLGKIGYDDKDQAPVKISLVMLEGQDVASWGGSVISAKALQYFMNVDFNIIDVPKDKRANLNMPILIVGGQPYKPVEEYLATGKFTLVGLDYEQIRSAAPFYHRVAANYEVNGKALSVTTIGVRALLLGKSFRKESRNNNMKALAQCINDNLADLADDPDTNPNWNSAFELDEDSNQTNWSYFPIK